MEIKSYINKYKWEVVKCPFCSHTTYVREVKKESPDPLRDLKRHITCKARSEALSHFLGGVVGKHLSYFKEHTKELPIVQRSKKRQFDDDLILTPTP